jgi:hypothetical protein
MTGPALLVAIALAEAATASVAPRDPPWRGLVVVLVPPIDDDVTRNALARVSGELAAAPFRTITKPIDPDRDVMAQVEMASSDQAATAAFALVRDRDPGSSRVTIWVSNRITGTTSMQRMQVEGGNVDRAAARLAVETVELVRASLAGLWPSPAAETTPPPVIEKSAPPPAPRGARLALGVGVGYLRDFGDAPATWAPQIALSYGRPASVGARLFASGLGPGASASVEGMGSTRFARTIVTLGLVRSFRAERIRAAADRDRRRDQLPDSPRDVVDAGRRLRSERVVRAGDGERRRRVRAHPAAGDPGRGGRADELART